MTGYGYYTNNSGEYVTAKTFNALKEEKKEQEETIKNQVNQIKNLIEEKSRQTDRIVDLEIKMAKLQDLMII